MAAVSAGNALIVDPDPKMLERLAGAFGGRGHREVIAVGDERTAVDILLAKEELSVVVVDVDAVPRGMQLALTAQLALPTPLVVATHTTLDAERAFALGRAGIRVLARKPFTDDELLRRIDDETTGPPPQVVPWVAAYVGRVGLFELETEVRRAMVLQAIMQSGESRLAAAKLLRVPRPIVQRAAPPRVQPLRRRRRPT